MGEWGSKEAHFVAGLMLEKVGKWNGRERALEIQNRSSQNSAPRQAATRRSPGS